MLRRVRPWQLCLAAAPAVIAAYYLVGRFGPGAATPQQVIFCLADAAISISCFVVAFRNRDMRAALVLIGASAMADNTGNIIFYAQALRGDVVYPGPSDIFYLALNPLMALGLLQIIRRRTPGWDGASAIDAAIVAVSSGYLMFIFIAVPTIAQAHGSHAGSLEVTVSLAYPAGDLILLLFTARLLLGAGPRTPSLGMLGFFCACLFSGDMIFAVQSLNGTYHPGSYLEGLWMAGEFALAAAVLHPSLPNMFASSDTATPDANGGRVLVLGLAATIAPTSMLVEYLRHTGHLNVPVAAITCDVLFLLVLVRMAGLVGAQRKAAITDGLTGLRSRRFFEQSLHQEIARNERSHAAMSMLILDIDFFKKVNDTYGHNGGDRVLVEISHRLKTLVRSGDLVARFGGEEFVVLLPATDAEGAREIAERVRRGIAASPIAVGGSRLHKVTVSIGVAGIPYTCGDGEELLLAADRALYASKHAGRDRVTVAGDDPAGEAAALVSCAPAPAPAAAAADGLPSDELPADLVADDALPADVGSADLVAAEPVESVGSGV